MSWRARFVPDKSVSHGQQRVPGRAPRFALAPVAAGQTTDRTRKRGDSQADAAVDGAGRLGGFGRVGGDGLFGDVGTGVERSDGADVELGAPAERAGGLAGGGRDGDGRVRVGDGRPDGVAEQLHGGPGGWRPVCSLRAVEAYDMEVDGPALLDLGDLAVRDPGGFFEFALGEPARAAISWRRRLVKRCRSFPAWLLKRTAPA